MGRQLRLALAARVADRYSLLASEPVRRLVLSIYRQGVRLLTGQKYPRRERWETLAEYAGRVGNLPAVIRLTEAAEIAAYRSEAPDAEIVARAALALATLKDELAQERK